MGDLFFVFGLIAIIVGNADIFFAFYILISVFRGQFNE